MTSVSAQEWQEFVASRPEANFLQSTEWAAANEAIGHGIVRDVIRRDGVIAAGWQGIIKDARRGRYLEVPGGPLLDWSDSLLVYEVTKQLRTAAKAHGCVFVRVRPQLVDEPLHRAYLKNATFKLAPFHLHAEHTNILDLTKLEDDVLAGMRRQTRYEVRRADKQDIIVTASSDKAAVDEFFAVQADTARRQGFVPSSKQFLGALVEAFGEGAKVYRAEKDGQLLNMALVMWSGEEADYFEAASTPESRKFAGAYGLQWQAIRDAKRAGKTRYNFWGIAYSDDPHHRYAGVTTFKRGFGGDDVTYVPAHDLIISRVRYVKNWLIETARKKKRKL
jgi:lipid II:glycine glycyltransferase (peptidoglycan interpeptide bridge formation enzyme)